MEINKFYKVFKFDKSFDQYCIDDVFVGGLSVDDIFNNLTVIFPDTEITVKREEWMSDADWEEESEFGKYKDGDTYIIPYFTEKEIKQIKDSLNTQWPRITEVKHLYTTAPYQILEGSSYME